MSNRVFAGLRATLLAAFLTSASGCAAYDVEYTYDVPESDADCPSGTAYRSGGTNVRDRSGGTNIRDRQGGDVSDYCEAMVCPGGETPGDSDPIIVWHLDDHKQIVARKTCPAT
jgi:hypothetical protein